MFDPVSLDGGRSGGDPPPGDYPDGGQVALLSEIGSEDANVEVAPLHPAQPAIEDAHRRIDGHRLVVIGRGAGTQRSGIDAILPEE
jgi:hypothetical protein